MEPEQLAIEYEDFCQWFESEHPDLCILVGEQRQAGQTPDQIKAFMVRLCYARGVHPLFAIFSMFWLHVRFGERYIAPVRFN